VSAEQFETSAPWHYISK